MKKEFEWNNELFDGFIKYYKRLSEDEPIDIDVVIHSFKRKHSAQEYPTGINSFSDNCSRNRFYQVFELSTSCPDDYQLWVSYNIKRPIHSVTNIHQEVLTVGDQTNYGKIDGFEIKDGALMARYLPYSGTYIDIDEVHPAKTVFKTEDGYDINFPCELYYVLKSGEGDVGCSAITDERHLKCDHYLYFKNESAANAYINKNKPRFSEKQLLDASDYDRNDKYLLIAKEKLGL